MSFDKKLMLSTLHKSYNMSLTCLINFDNLIFFWGKIEETTTSLTPYYLHNIAILMLFSAISLTAVSLLKFLKSLSFDPMCITTVSG